MAPVRSKRRGRGIGRHQTIPEKPSCRSRTQNPGQCIPGHGSEWATTSRLLWTRNTTLLPNSWFTVMSRTSACSRRRQLRPGRTWRSRRLMWSRTEAITRSKTLRPAKPPVSRPTFRSLIEVRPNAVATDGGPGAFLTRRLANVRGEFSLTALAYNLRRATNLVGIPALIAVVAR